MGSDGAKAVDPHRRFSTFVSTTPRLEMPRGGGLQTSDPLFGGHPADLGQAYIRAHHSQPPKDQERQRGGQQLIIGGSV